MIEVLRYLVNEDKKFDEEIVLKFIKSLLNQNKFFTNIEDLNLLNRNLASFINKSGKITLLTNTNYSEKLTLTNEFLVMINDNLLQANSLEQFLNQFKDLEKHPNYNTFLV